MSFVIKTFELNHDISSGDNTNLFQIDLIKFNVVSVHWIFENVQNGGQQRGFVQMLRSHNGINFSDESTVEEKDKDKEGLINLLNRVSAEIVQDQVFAYTYQTLFLSRFLRGAFFRDTLDSGTLVKAIVMGKTE